MRHHMLRDTPLNAAVFIGGMDGVTTEFADARDLDIPTYAVAHPGGAAAVLPQTGPLSGPLKSSDLYSWLMSQVVADVVGAAA